ncbi:hypothetical protein [Streptomyces albidochromogenes]|uniref:Uncharacterized protein n=1 Tax=Streptomyces albidochromogenes TaxID=329524 RepID=A0ABW6FH44_9ACTN
MIETDVNKAVALQVYRTIQHIIMGDLPVEGVPEEQAESPYPSGNTYVTLEPVGRLLEEGDYKDPWTPSSKKGHGNLDAARALIDLVDMGQETYPIARATNNTVDHVYADIVSKPSVKAGQPDPDLEAQLDAADKVLFHETEDGDIDDSPKYRHFKKLRTAYNDARAKYLAARLDLIEKGVAIEDVEVRTTSQKQTMNDAYDDWQGIAEDIEDALNVKKTSGKFLVNSVFARAKTNFEKSGYELGVPDATYHPVRVYPSTWASADAARSNWPTLTITHKETETDKTEEERNLTADGGFGNGFWGWNIDSEGGGEIKRDKLHKNTKNLKISFKYALCSISRSWFDATLFHLPNWSAPFRAGGISDGTRSQPSTQHALPMVPTAFLCVRDVEISADWGDDVKDYLSAANHQKIGVGFGPFKLAGYAENNKNETTHQAVTFDGDTLKQPGLQIVAWVHEILPYSPPVGLTS